MGPDTTQQTPKVNLQQFGDNLKKKHADVILPDGRKYSDVDSVEAAQKYLSKHPEYAPYVDTTLPKTGPQKAFDFLEEKTPLGEFGTGAAKGIVHTVKSISDIGTNVLDTAFHAAGADLPNENALDNPDLTEAIKPQGLGEQAGYGAEQLGEFLIPEVKVAKLPAYTKAALNIAKDIGIAGEQTEGNAGAMGATGIVSGALRAIPVVGSIPFVRDNIVKLMAKGSGYAPKMLETALRRAPTTVAAAKGDENVIVNAVKKTVVGLNEHANNLLKESKDKVAELSKASVGGKGDVAAREEVLQQGRDFAGNVAKNLRAKYNIGVKGDGVLSFNRETMPSNIVSGSDQRAIKEAYASLQGLGKDTSIKNIDAVYERLVTLAKTTPGGTATGAETKKIIQEMINETLKFTHSLAGVSPAYEDYATFKTANLSARKWVNDAQQIFGASSNPSAKHLDTAMNNMLQVFNQNKTSTRALAKEVGEKTGQDAVGASAGTQIADTGPISARATQLTSSGRATLMKILEAIPRNVVRNYVKEGTMSGPFLQGIAHLVGGTAADVAKIVGELLDNEQQ